MRWKGSQTLTPEDEIRALEKRVTELERLVTYAYRWIAALSANDLKVLEVSALFVAGRNDAKRDRLVDELFEDFYRMHPDKRPPEQPSPESSLSLTMPEIGNEE